jgi:adenylate cyclase
VDQRHTSIDGDDAAASAEAVIAALQRVLESSVFAKAEQSRRFLAFVAHETLAGRGDQVNERSIARIALDRPADIDVRDDPSVRVLAGRIRERLARYYQGEGRRDSLRISMPVGQYALVCTGHRPVESVAAPPTMEGPMIAVTRFKSAGRGTAGHRLAAGLSESLVHALTRFPGVRVAGPLASSAMAEGTDAIDIGVRTTAHFALFGRVRELDQLIRVNVQLAETTHGEVVWSEQFDVDAATYGGFAAEDEIVARLAAEVADHHGAALRAPIAPTRLSDEPAGYRAITSYYQFVDSLDRAEGLVAVDELEVAVAAEPSNAFLVGLLASAHSVSVLLRGAAGAPEALIRAEELGRRSLTLDPENPYALGALATVALAEGDHVRCREHVAALVEVAPHHPSFLYRAGLLTAGCGDWDDGIAIITRATRLNPHHPSHFRTMIVIDHLRRDDFAAALAEAQLIRFEGYIWAPLCLAICLKELGMLDEAREEVAALARTAPDFFERPRDFVAAGPAIPAEVVEQLLGHVPDLAALVPGQEPSSRPRQR